MNPAVTLAFIRKSKDNIPWKTGLVYMLAQFIGGIVGAFVSVGLLRLLGISSIAKLLLITNLAYRFWTCLQTL